MSMQSNYSIGIYMPTHNRVELLKKAIDSVLQQTYKNFKLVIVNDGSSDETKEYLDSIEDTRVIALHNEVSQGACRSRNRAIHYLDTDLVTGLDDDDTFLPDRLEKLLAVYDEKYSFVCSGYFWDYGAHQKPLFDKDRVISLSDAFDLNQCSNQILVDRARILGVGCFDEKIPALQDHDLWVRLIAKYGKAYRIGEPSYIVNDDRSLERISSVKNKLNAIEIFENKHASIMSERNRNNFKFYKSKILKEKVSFSQFLTSTKYGLKSLKVRYFFSQYFSSFSKARLQYLQHGHIEEQGVFKWILDYFIPLIATGGPGASRVILLSSCIFFLGLSESASFSGDFFVLMLLNTVFCQSYGFFLLKPEYNRSFASVFKQSFGGLCASLLCCLGLGAAGVISEPLYASILIVLLHFYYLFRFYNIANRRFIPIAAAELIISFLCLILPIALSVFSESNDSDIPYYVYLTASGAGLLIIVLFKVDWRTLDKVTVPFSKLRNIAVSTSAGIFAVFLMPASIKQVVEPEVVSLVALTISCISITMLIPRTYANKIMYLLAGHELSRPELSELQSKYTRIMLQSAVVGLILTVAYIVAISTKIETTSFMVPMAISSILVSAQLGFINLTFLSLQGFDKDVAKLNSYVVIITSLVALSLVVDIIKFEYFIVLAVALCCICFLIRNKIAKDMINQKIACVQNK